MKIFFVQFFYVCLPPKSLSLAQRFTYPTFHWKRLHLHIPEPFPSGCSSLSTATSLIQLSKSKTKKSPLAFLLQSHVFPSYLSSISTDSILSINTFSSGHHIFLLNHYNFFLILPWVCPLIYSLLSTLYTNWNMSLTPAWSLPFSCLFPWDKFWSSFHCMYGFSGRGHSYP